MNIFLLSRPFVVLLFIIFISSVFLFDVTSSSFFLFVRVQEMVKSFKNHLNIQFSNSPFYPGTSLHNFINKHSLSHSLEKLVAIQTDISKPRGMIIH